MGDTIQKYISTWAERCYKDLPDESPREIDHLVPSYKRIAMCILKNDLKGIGEIKKESEWYGVFKRIELSKRKGFVIQLKLF